MTDNLPGPSGHAASSSSASSFQPQHDDAEPLEAGPSDILDPPMSSAPRVLIISPTGEYCVGVDENHKPEPAAQEPREPPPPPERRGSVDVLNHALSIVTNPNFLRQFPGSLTPSHEAALYMRRKRSFLFLLAMDFCYFLLLFLIKLLIKKQKDQEEEQGDGGGIGAGDSVREVEIEGERSPSSPEVPVMIFTPVPGFEIIDLCVNLALDLTGLIGAWRDSISTLTFFIMGESVSTSMSALHRLSPFLIFRVIIVMLGFQVRAGCHMLQRQQQELQQQIQQHLAALEPGAGAEGSEGSGDSSLPQGGGRHFSQMASTLQEAREDLAREVAAEQNAHQSEESDYESLRPEPIAGRRGGGGGVGGGLDGIETSESGAVVGNSLTLQSNTSSAMERVRGTSSSMSPTGAWLLQNDLDNINSNTQESRLRSALGNQSHPSSRTLQRLFNQRRMEFGRTYLQIAFLASMLQAEQQQQQQRQWQHRQHRQRSRDINRDQNLQLQDLETGQMPPLHSSSSSLSFTSSRPLRDRPLPQTSSTVTVGGTTDLLREANRPGELPVIIGPSNSRDPATAAREDWIHL